MRWNVHPEAIPWAPSPAQQKTIETAFPFPEVTVEILPRRQIGQRTGKILHPYAFRAVSRGNEALVFVDATETPRSIAWLIAHELAHHELRRHPGTRAWFERTRPLDLDPASDSFHDVDPEERYADGRATRLFGQRFDRAWWRARTPRTA